MYASLMRAPDPITAGPLLDHHASLDARVRELALDAALHVLEHEPVGLQHVGELSGVLPPAAHQVRLDTASVVDQALDGVGDLELAATGGLDGPRRVEDVGTEHVDAD